jgi:probable HAF family extracellular repeat protein
MKIVRGFALIIGIASVLHAQTITTFDVPNSTSTVPQANNLFGQITGYYQDAIGVHGFLRLRNSIIATFDPTGSTGTYATAINDKVQIAGYYFGTDNAAHGFVRQRNGTITTFDAPNSPYLPDPEVCEWQTTDTLALAINAAGQIAGYQRQHLVGLNGFLCGGLRYQGFQRDRDGSVVTFGVTWAENADAEFVSPKSINLFGQITGYFQSTDLATTYFHGGFLRQPDGTITIFGGESPGDFTYAAAINLFGQITGYSQDANNVVHGFLRQPNSTMVAFDPVGSTGTQPTAINDLGEITGSYSANNSNHGFVRRRNGAITTFDIPEASTRNGAGTFPVDINLLGQLTGYYQDTNLVLHGFIRNPH